MVERGVGLRLKREGLRCGYKVEESEEVKRWNGSGCPDEVQL